MIKLVRLSEEKKMNIDFVVPWVDGNDPNWQRKKAMYVTQGIETASFCAARYRDWNMFNYWFRAVEKNAPWVRYIYLVTDHQVPAFLKTDHPKLKIVFHDEFIPEKYLPVFSSRSIELNFHRLPGLSEHFVYFNDDMYINKPMKPEDFFRKGRPCYAYIERPLTPYWPVDIIQSAVINEMAVINRHFSRDSILKRPWLYLNYRYGKHAIKNALLLPWRKFQHFEDDHMPCPYLKSTFEEVWAHAQDVLDATCRHRFRNREDVNQYIFKYWALASGNFSPIYREPGYYSLNPHNVQEAVDDIIRGSHAMICINDSYSDEYELLSQTIRNAFQKRYPNPSSFELSEMGAGEERD